MADKRYQQPKRPDSHSRQQQQQREKQRPLNEQTIDINFGEKVTKNDRNLQVNVETPTSSFVRAIKGPLYALLSAASFSLTSICIRKASTFSTMDIVFIRFLVKLCYLFILIKLSKKYLNPFGESGLRSMLTFRGLVNLSAVLGMCYSFVLINPSDTVAIYNSSLVIIAVLSRFVFKEKLGAFHLTSLVLTIVGVLFIAKPTFLFESNATTIKNATLSESAQASASVRQTAGVLCALLTAVCLAVSAILIKKLSIEGVPYPVVNIYGAYVGLPVSFVGMIGTILLGNAHSNFMDQEASQFPKHLLYAIGAAFFTLFGNIFLNLSLEYDDALKSSVIRTTEILFVSIWQFLILGLTLDKLSIVGSCFIIFGMVLILLMKLLESKFGRSKHPAWKCILFKL